VGRNRTVTGDDRLVRNFNRHSRSSCRFHHCLDGGGSWPETEEPGGCHAGAVGRISITTSLAVLYDCIISSRFKWQWDESTRRALYFNSTDQ
jgi:hypothetical protein